MCFCVFSVSVCDYLSVCFSVFLTVMVYLCLFCPLSFFQMLLVQASQGICVLGYTFVLLWGSTFSICTMRPSSPSGLQIMLRFIQTSAGLKTLVLEADSTISAFTIDFTMG